MAADPSSCREETAGTAAMAVMEAPEAILRFATPRLLRSPLEMLTAARAEAPAKVAPAEREDRLEKKEKTGPAEGRERPEPLLLHK